QYFGNPKYTLFQNISTQHLMIQLANGVVNIGLTYFLINRALTKMQSAGHFASFLASVGISYAVLFTLLFEFLGFGIEISLLQWVGVVLFSIGFATVRENIGTART